MNYIKILFGQMVITVVIISGIFNTLEEYLPVFIIQTVRYGKFAYKKSSTSIFKPIDVPKSWFKHFYIFAAFISSMATYLSINTYVLNNSVPPWMVNLLNISVGKQQFASVTPAATLLAILLLTLQCYRRLYDTHFVSVFSKNGRINLSHYLIGYIHYTGAFLAILSEAPKFATNSEANSELQLSDISYLHLMSTVLFLWSWWHQYKVTEILGNLRKNANGTIVSQKHYMPEGDLFTYVSSPHLFTEILMYISLTVILWQNTTWWFITFWVVSNQVESALLSHWWYQETFAHYPKQRKALIPFVY